MLAATPATQEQYRHVGIRRYKLEAPCCDHRHPAGFRDYDGGRSVAHRVFDHRQQRRVVKRLRVDHVGRGQPGLLQARCVKVVAAARPENRATTEPGLARRDAGQEQRRRGVVDQCWADGSRFMECASAQPTPAKSRIQLRKPS